MRKITIHNKDKLFYMARMTALVTGMVCVLGMPLMSVGRTLIRHYQIVVGNQNYGYYDTAQEASVEVRKARKAWADKNGADTLTETLCCIQPVERIAKGTQMEGIQEQLYQAFEENKVMTVENSYTIKVDDFTVTVASEGAVLTTLQNIKDKYDEAGCYGIHLDMSEEGNCMYPSFYLKEGAQPGDMTGMGFEQSIEIVEGYTGAAEVTEPAAAAAALTKEWETPTVYTVQSGDCLSLIAENHGMKTSELMQLNQLSDSEYVNIGDELIVTVPQPEISVWYTKRASYEETYQADVIYKDNSSWYVGTEKVLQQPVAGHRQVVADIRYRNGEETGREILEETILSEAKPKIVERGTSTPPSYIKPLVGGSFSSPFGSRWGRMHKGIDWSCSIGTAIRASCGGRVVSAGWVNGYGNCIVLSHSDGKKTKYAHLSKILVSSGQTVKQGEKIALSGNTGNSTGPHLHFEILVGGTQVNPLKYLK